MLLQICCGRKTELEIASRAAATSLQHGPGICLVGGWRLKGCNIFFLYLFSECLLILSFPLPERFPALPHCPTPSLPLHFSASQP